MNANKWKQGDIHPETGLVYWSKQASCKNGERWMAQEKYLAKKEMIRAYVASEAGRAAIAKRRNTDAERKKRNEYAKVWGKSDKRRALAAGYARRRRAENHLAAIADRYRARLREALRTKGISKRSSTSEILGCSWPELVAHIESLFLPGMTWGNRGEWEIDHHIPLASAENEKQMLALCKYTNLRPLWRTENRKKSWKMPELLDKAVCLKRAIAKIDAQQAKQAGKPEGWHACGNVGMEASE